MADSQDTLKTYYADPILANAAGHDVLADVLIAYMQMQVCTVWSGATGHSYDTLPLLAADAVNVKQPTDARALFGGIGQRPGGAAGEEGVRPPEAKGAKHPKLSDNGRGLTAHMQVPAARINTRPSDLESRPWIEVAPFCASANDLINPLPSSIFAGSGWRAVHPSAGAQDLYVGEHYWEASMPGSRFRIPLQLGAGDVGVFYVREPRQDIGEGSYVDCWVDDNVPGAKRISNAADVGDLQPA
jgi:hypothetical protein